MISARAKIQDTEFIYDLFESMREDNLSYVYRGVFTPNITDNILALAENGFVQNTPTKVIRRRVYNVMVEGLQNITKHQANQDSGSNLSNGVFVLKKEEDKYFVTTGNLVHNNEIDNLSKQIEYVNKLNRSELKDYHKQRLIEGSISEKGGAGLGLIDMAIKSGNKLSFTFEKADSLHSYFYLHTEIISKKQEDNNSNSTNDNEQHIKDLHKALNDKNILIIFNSYFNQENLLGLLSIIEKQMQGKLSFRKRMYSLMVEMLQNIIQHGDEYNQTDEGKAGLFYISEQKKKYYLNTGNYILKTNIDKLKKHVEYINSLNDVELENFYDQRLLDIDIDTNKESGLGLIDMRIKSQNQLTLDFFDVDSTHAFCILRTQIDN